MSAIKMSFDMRRYVVLFVYIILVLAVGLTVSRLAIGRLNIIDYYVMGMNNLVLLILIALQ